MDSEQPLRERLGLRAPDPIFDEHAVSEELTRLEGDTRPPPAGLTTDPADRKNCPVFSGVLKYFPDALIEVARCSKKGNDQHNPGQPLHWAKHKSTDEGDALVRHLLESGTVDTDGIRHSAKVAWRALALLQREIERERGEYWHDAEPPVGRMTATEVKVRGGRVFDYVEKGC